MILQRIGKVRSLVPASVNLMALTATAKKSLQKEVAIIYTKIESSENCCNITIQPKHNLYDQILQQHKRSF